LRFVRNLICARILCPADFGIAATCALATTLLEMVTDLGLERMLVQDKEGDDDRLGATAQLLLVLRGFLIAGVLFALADPLAVWFKAPQAVSAFRVMAVLPILSGLVHRDTIRFQRELRFGPWVTCRVLPDVVITLAAWPVALWMRNYWAFVVLELVRGCLALVLSHVVSERSYRLGWDRSIAWRFISFGWPLLLNGLLMYGALQGDRVVVGLASTPVELGLYSIGVMLALTPAMMVGSIATQLLLPVLARVQDDLGRFERIHRVCLAGLTALAVAFGSALVLVGPWLVRVLYGEKYVAAGAIIGWLGAAQAAHIIRVGTTVSALALGDTRNSLFSNTFRLSGLGLAVAFAAAGYHLREIAAAACVGEAAALAGSVGFLWWRHGVGLSIGLQSVAILGIALAFSGAAASVGFVNSSVLTSASALFLVGVVLSIVLLAISQDLRSVFRQKWVSSLRAARGR